MVPPTKQPNAVRRSREHMTAAEIGKMIAAARRLGRHGHRDATMILLAFRHGLRVSELVGLRREQVDLEQGFCTCVDGRTACQARIRYMARRYEPYGKFCANIRKPPTFSSPNARRR